MIKQVVLLHDIILLDISPKLSLLGLVPDIGVVAYHNAVLLLEHFAECLVKILLGSLLVSCGEQISLGVYIHGTIVNLLDQHLLLMFGLLRHSLTRIYLEGLKEHILLGSFAVESSLILVLSGVVAVLQRWKSIALIHLKPVVELL